MKDNLWKIVVTVGWGVIVASLSLQALYIRPLLSALDIFLLFLASVAAGMVLVDVKAVVLSFVVALAIAISLMYFCLTLPSTLGIAGDLTEALQSGAVVMVFKGIFPTSVLAILFGGFFGSIIAERLRLS